jgi:hypothetical protein
MAADVGERISLVAREPVLEVRAAVAIGLNEFRLTHSESAEVAELIMALGDQCPPVEPLVVLDPDEQPPFVC